MNKKLLAAALARVLKNAGVASEELLSQLLSLFIGKAIVVPLPAYGDIVYDVEGNYAFPGLKRIFDAKKDDLVSFFEAELSPFFNHEKLQHVPSKKQNDIDFHWDNDFFPQGDARALYALLARYNPARMIEIGVGNSTKIARKAINDFSLRTKIISIDPSPRANINGVTDVHLQESMTGVDLRLYDQLKEGDILFIDGSHVCHCGTDVPHYALNILPRLKSGVMVHIHDIFLPWEYYDEFRIRHYNEQHVVGAFVACEANWELLFPVHYLFREECIPFDGGSLWLLKK